MKCSITLHNITINILHCQTYNMEPSESPPMPSNGKNLILLAVSLLCLLAFSIVFMPQSWTQMQADWALDKLPDENNRISHPCGMSFVVPSGWAHSLAVAKGIDDDNGISLFGLTTSQRHRSIIKIFEHSMEKYRENIEANPVYKSSVFQGLPALEKLDVDKRSNGIEDPSSISGEMYFLRNDKCYCIIYYFPFCDTVPKNLPLYLDSFQAGANQDTIK